MKWVIPENNSEQGIIQSLLEQREIEDKEVFFSPSEAQLNDPFLLHDAEKAAEFILNAIKDKKKIFIHGDFDVDGVTGTSIMWRFLYQDLGADVTPYIPNRFEEGYGLSEKSVEAIIEAGGDLIITVDCGVKDVEVINKYSDKIDFIITDHHTLLSEKEFTQKQAQDKNLKKVGKYLISDIAKAVVHPALGEYPFSQISGSVVSWKLCSVINKLAGEKIDINNYIDLASIGTVCDIMPLIDENRAITHLGLVRLANQPNIGIKSLLEASGVDRNTKYSTYHYGFVIGPRINAAGRLESALDAVRLLATDSEVNASKLSSKLFELNKQRQDLTQKYYEEALSKIQSEDPDGNGRVYFVHGEAWPEGILGLIAGKLAQRFNRPVLVATESGKQLKGSARSIEKYHISNAFKDLDKYFIRHGGHAQAAGFQLDPSTLPEFITALKEHAEKHISADDLQRILFIDEVINPEDLNLDLAEELSAFEPYGQGNPEPIFAILDTEVIDYRFIGKESNHVKLTLSKNGVVLTAIGFGMAKRAGPILDSKQNIDIAGNIMINEWNGQKNIELRLMDIRTSSN